MKSVDGNKRGREIEVVEFKAWRRGNDIADVPFHFHSYNYNYTYDQRKEDICDF